MNQSLRIEYIPIENIKPYENNAKLHPQEQIQQIKNSILEFGFNDPLALWHDTIVEGHGRLLAAQELGYKELPIIRLDDLSDEQRKAYCLAHNKLTMNSDFDLDVLSAELDSILDIDMSVFGFELDLGDLDSGETYTSAINIPQYEVQEETPKLSECYDISKSNSLIDEINNSNLKEEEKEFLRLAANRHNMINYRKIAEYYASANEEMQKLMEKSALVIIDYNDAIANGYTKLKDSLEEMRLNDE